MLRYYIDRVQMNIDLLNVSEIISRTTESARVFGIDFYSVITRGSQFKVESIMFRIAKPENFVLISPSRKQVFHFFFFYLLKKYSHIIFIVTVELFILIYFYSFKYLCI